MSDQTYHEKMDSKNIKQLRTLLKSLPNFAKDYFRAAEATKSTKTRLSYAHDLHVFFNFLYEKNPSLKGKEINTLPVHILDQLEPVDIEEYQEFLTLYYKDDKEIKNKEAAVKRKMASLRSFYAYYYKHEMISHNPTLIVDMPKIREKAIIRLDPDEVALLLDYIENCGENLSKKKREYYEKTKLRDLALITLLLGTGIRVSECVGLDVQDVDFRNNALKITRKGGNQTFVYFGSEVERALLSYLEVRELLKPVQGHENALFLSLQRKRINVRSVQILVKEYAKSVTTTKKITPHKLRSTFGTNLYKETGDIYLVADVLGHKDVSTTKKHYAAMDEERRRKAASAVTLRED